MPQVADWVTIADFTPGIHADWHENYTGVSTAAPRNGAATETGTYRCVSDRNGHLIPLPRPVTTYTREVPFCDQGNTATLGFPGGIPKAVLLDAVVFGPVVETQTSTEILDSFPETVYTLWGIVYDPLDPLVQNYQYVRGTAIGLFGGATAFDFLFVRGVVPIAGTVTYPAGALDKTRGTVSTATFTADQYRPAVVGGAAFARSGRASTAAAGAMLGNEATRTNYDTVTNVDGAAPAATRYPRTTFSTPNLNGAFGASVVLPTPSVGHLNMPASAVQYPLVCAHQGRVVFARRMLSQNYGHAGNVGWALHDYIAYTPVGDFGALGTEAIWGEEGSSPIGALLSMSANELFVARHAGGGLLIRGDLDNPQVYRLPFAHSTGGFTSRAVATPIGAFYGTRDGVVRWAGGDTTELVSKQLDGAFWRPHTELIEGMHGRFCWWNPYVVTPGGWLMHSDTGGWWKLDDLEIPYSHFDTSPNDGRLYAFPYKVEGTGTKTWWQTFTAGELSRSYEWTSQPLLETMEREFNAAEIELTAQRMPDGFVTGVATIEIELTGYTSEGTVVTATNTFTLNDNAGPQLHVQAVDANFVARYVQIHVTADSGNNNMPAPKIMQLRLGRSERARTGRT